jgi:hypothetical protein
MRALNPQVSTIRVQRKTEKKGEEEEEEEEEEEGNLQQFTTLLDMTPMKHLNRLTGRRW